MRLAAAILFTLTTLFATTGAVAQDAAPRILFLSKSSGFQHGSITEKDGKPSHVEKVLRNLAESAGAEFTATKDASVINTENLANYELVIFYTTGYLTQPGTDGYPPMPEFGVADLITWIKDGGGFMGFHCATDTFHNSRDGEPTDYTKLIGGSFLTHGSQFAGKLEVVDTDHPLAVNIPQGFTKNDEWYMFRNLNTEKMHVIALLDPGAERAKQKRYDVPNYPVIWCRGLGDGRVYYNAMGHREDVWDDTTFQTIVVDAATWCLGQGPLDAEPNYAKVVPAE